MKTGNLILFGKWTGLISFLAGTAIFLLYFFTSSSRLPFVGYVFLLMAGAVNMAVLAILLVKALKDPVNRKSLIKTGGLLLINIPVAILYCWFSIILWNTLRITFHNSTNTTLTDIHIRGCETIELDKLGSGESRTIWIRIPGDCSVNIQYMKDGNLKEENVSGYITNEMGRKITWNIGGGNDMDL